MTGKSSMSETIPLIGHPHRCAINYKINIKCDICEVKCSHQRLCGICLTVYNDILLLLICLVILTDRMYILLSLWR